MNGLLVAGTRTWDPLGLGQTGALHRRGRVDDDFRDNITSLDQLTGRLTYLVRSLNCKQAGLLARSLARPPARWLTPCQPVKLLQGPQTNWLVG